MKKYFVSYNFQNKNSFGFGNLVRTSIKNKIDFSDIIFWEEEISNKKQFDKVCILSFREMN